jgi:hypothetical protein
MKKTLVLAVFFSFCALLPCGCSKPLTEDFFPLKVGNSWTYRAIVDGGQGQAGTESTPEPVKMELKVTKADKIGTQECMVLELFFEDKSESSQKEYYARVRDGLAVMRRTYGKEDMDLNPPELMLKVPPEVGQTWKWSGKCKDAKGDFTFAVEKTEKIKAMDKDFECLKYIIRGMMEGGEKLTSERWFARNVGMIRESTIMQQGTKQLRVTATLESYNAGQSAARIPSNNAD